MKKVTIAFYLIFCLIQGQFVCLAQETDSAYCSMHRENIIKYDRYWEKFISDARRENDNVRGSITGWSIAVAIGIVTILGGLLPILTFRNFSKESSKVENKLKGLNKDIEDYNKIIAELKGDFKKITDEVNEINSRSLTMRDSILSYESSLIENKPFEYVSGKNEDIFVKKDDILIKDAGMLTRNIDIENVVNNDNLSAKNIVFRELVKLYINSQDSKLVLCEFEKLLDNIDYINDRFRILHYMGYIHGDEIYNKNLNYAEAKRCYDKCLKLDIHRQEKNIYIILNDLGNIEMKLAEGMNKTEKRKHYKRAMSLLDESIEILNKREIKIKWSNPYKNKGYCLGKLAMLEESYDEQIRLFMQSFAMYQIAFSLNTYFKLINDYFKVTIEDFINCICHKNK